METANAWMVSAVQLANWRISVSRVMCLARTVGSAKMGHVHVKTVTAETAVKTKTSALQRTLIAKMEVIVMMAHANVSRAILGIGANTFRLQ